MPNEAAKLKHGRNIMKQKTMNSKYVSIRHFAEHFGINKQTVSSLIKRGKIKAMMMYGTTMWRIAVEEIEVYKQNSKTSKVI
jgi:excisionase family DNA binding protein